MVQFPEPCLNHITKNGLGDVNRDMSSVDVHEPFA